MTELSQLYDEVVRKSCSRYSIDDYRAARFALLNYVKVNQMQAELFELTYGMPACCGSPKLKELRAMRTGRYMDGTWYCQSGESLCVNCGSTVESSQDMPYTKVTYSVLPPFVPICKPTMRTNHEAAVGNGK